MLIQFGKKLIIGFFDSFKFLYLKNFRSIRGLKVEVKLKNVGKLVFFYIPRV